MIRIVILLVSLLTTGAFKSIKLIRSRINSKLQVDPACINHIDFNIIQVGIAGGLAGGFRGLSRVLTYPWDTIKTLEQAEGDPSTTKRPDKLSITDYFRGLGPTILAAIPANAVFFIVYNYLDIVSPCLITSSVPALYKRLLIALIATLPQNAIKIPAEVVKQRTQVSFYRPLPYLLYE